MKIIATVTTAIALAAVTVGCDSSSLDDAPGPHRDKQGRLQLQDNPALDGLNPEKDCAKYPELEACKLYYGD